MECIEKGDGLRKDVCYKLTEDVVDSLISQVT
jgi:hypothetical protein